jgi:hypothetical protein
VRELFIYYRLQLVDAAAWQAKVLAMQRSLKSRHPGLQARLLCRPEPVDGWQTWMETYAWPGHPGGVSKALQDEIESLAKDAAAAVSPAPLRHIEVFAPCAS